MKIFVKEIYKRVELRLLGKKYKKNIFSYYFKSNFWGSEESRSGPGSTLLYTENLRKDLPCLVKELNIDVFLDAPCGDFNWMKEVCFSPKVKYFGGDVVPEMITELQAMYSHVNRKFEILDIVNSSLPRADIWLCRDVLFHLSNADVLLVLENFIDSDIPWLLTSTHSQNVYNKDILSGDFRLLNLERFPFNLPKAEKYIEDYISGFPVRHLGLWHKDTLKKWIEKRENIYEN